MSGTPWPAVLADYIRNNDQLLIENTDRLLALFEHEIAPCESFAEYCDVMGESSRGRVVRWFSVWGRDLLGGRRVARLSAVAARTCEFFL